MSLPILVSKRDFALMPKYPRMWHLANPSSFNTSIMCYLIRHLLILLTVNMSYHCKLLIINNELFILLINSSLENNFRVSSLVFLLLSSLFLFLPFVNKYVVFVVKGLLKLLASASLKHRKQRYFLTCIFVVAFLILLFITFLA